MKTRKIGLLLVLASSFLLGSCGQPQNPTNPDTDDTTTPESDTNKPNGGEVELPKYFKEVEDLKKGFTAKGEITLSTEYFRDITHFRPSDLLEDTNSKLAFNLIYEDSDRYIGTDRRFYKVENDVKKFYFGQNIFNDFGYVGMNYVDYENNVRRDGYAADDDGNLIPYSASGYINPFKLIKHTDLIDTKDGTKLSRDKASIFFTTLFGDVDEIEENVVVENNKLTFENGALKAINLKTNPLSGITSVKVDGQYKNVYSLTNYDLKIEFSEVGTASAYNAIKEEPEKPENDIVTDAMAKLADGNYTVRRRLKAFDKTNQEYVKEQQAIDVYYAGDAIYQSIYDYGINKEATGQEHAVSPSEADLLFKDSPKDEDERLNTYSLKINEDASEFRPAGGLYPNIENLFNYEQLLLCFTPVDDENSEFVNVSGDVFNKNEDGSFTPIDDNLPYMASDCFVSQLQTTEEIAGGYVTDFRLFIKNADTDPTLDRVELIAEFGPFVHYITLTYEDFGTTKIPFGVLDLVKE